MTNWGEYVCGGWWRWVGANPIENGTWWQRGKIEMNRNTGTILQDCFHCFCRSDTAGQKFCCKCDTAEVVDQTIKAAELLKTLILLEGIELK